MKIGIDCRLWSETGVGRYIRNLVLNLQKIDKKNSYVLFILDKNKKEAAKIIQSSNFKTVETNIRWHSLKEQLKFPQVLNKESLDLVHFPYFSVPIFYNYPFVITIHDLIVDHFSTGYASTLPTPSYRLKRLAYKFVLAKAAKKAKKIIAVSKATKDEIADHLKVNPQKIEVTYEGVDSLIQNSRIKNQKYKSKFKNYFLYVGNGYPHKNLDRLLEAFKVLNNYTQLVMIVRQDYFCERLKKKVGEMKLSDKIIFMHNVGDEDLASLYSNAKALILPSLMEGFGLPALEAMANSCLVLASDIPSLHEVCGDAAIYFDPYDIRDMAKKMNDVYLNNIYHLSRKKEEGSEWARFFSWKKMAKETLEIYNSAVNNS